MARSDIFLLPLLALLPFSGCDDAEPAGADDEIVEPDLDSKSDEFSGLVYGGVLAFGDTAEGTFDEASRFFEYSFQAREGAQLSIETTESGSSGELDTTLFLYRQGAGEPSQIAIDDDGGLGTLSRIDHRISAAGEYSIVVGTKGASGKGSFTLSLGCAEGECEPEELPLACHPVLQDALDECLAQTAIETDYEVSALDMVMHSCDGWLSLAPDEICPQSGEPLCDDSDAAIDRCKEYAESIYVAPATSLAKDNDGGLDSLVEAVYESAACASGENGGCGFDGALYQYSGEAPPVYSLLSFARSESTVGPGAFLDQTPDSDVATVEGLISRYGVESEFEAMLKDANLDLAEAQVSITEFGEFHLQQVGCEGGILVLTFPTAQRVLMLQDMVCNIG